jgi:predicted TIM-barrel fold metal-dependent hydrolase
MTYKLISADSHVNPPPTMWREYLPAGFRELAPRLETTDEGDFQVFEGRRTPIMGINSMAGKKPEEYSWNVRRLEEHRPGGWDPAERLKDQETDGVEAEVLYGGGPLASADPALRRASYAAYNDWLADFCAAAPKRLIGVAYIPFESVDGAVAEIRRSKLRGLHTAVMPGAPPFGDWVDADWAPLWETLVELGMPAAFHAGMSTGPPRLDTGPHFLTDVSMSKFKLSEPIAGLIFAGVPQKFPDLRILCVEGQLGWIPFAQYYWDHIWNKHRYWTKSELPEPPSFYFRRQVYATFMEDPVGIRERDAIGLPNIMWSSDYPHSETTWPNSRALIGEWFAGVPEDETRQIVRDNARAFYGL